MSLEKLTRHIDYKIGLLGAVITGGIVYLINDEYGLEKSLIASSKQAAYTFLIGGYFTKMCEKLAIKSKTKNLAMLSSLIPALLTIGSTYFVHTLKGTPEIFESTIPTIALSPFFLYWSQKKWRDARF